MDVLLLHHVAGRTEGMLALADRLRAGGHEVSVPDLLDGRTFPSVEAGVDHVERVGFDAPVRLGVEAAEAIVDPFVVVGVSLGVMPAVRLAVEHPGVRAVVALEGIVTPSAYGAWPDGLPMQAHARRDDPWAEVPIIERVVTDVGGELHLYQGAGHLFTDASMPAHDPASTELVVQRVLGLLDRLG